jgi:probable addiction module antidote protein
MAYANFGSMPAPGIEFTLSWTETRLSSFCVVAAKPHSGGISPMRKPIGRTLKAPNGRRLRLYEDFLVEQLKKDRKLARDYLKSALEDEDPRVFLLALRHVAQALGMSKVAGKSKLNRESLYKALSKRGNPSLQTLSALLDAVGFRLTVEFKDAA